MFVYMMVSKDKYQLPLAIADSASELARMVGKSSNTTRSAASHAKAGKIKNSIFYRVEIAEDDE